MKKILPAFAIAVLTGFGGAAYADIYGAGPAYGGNPTGGLAACRVMNIGTSSVTITSRRIVTNTNQILALSTDTCGVAALAAGSNCEYHAPVVGNFALSCRLLVVGTDPQISGTLDVQNPVGTVIVVVPMQNSN